MIYLASPYSHPDAQIREERFDAACRVAAYLVDAGHSVFSPIVHGHPLVRFGLPTDWAYWESHDRQHLARCTALVVLALEGWERAWVCRRRSGSLEHSTCPSRFSPPWATRRRLWPRR